ncbi:hypothetical protein CDAR_229861 [Caerostris darwini]|uniref:Uncharacterized protein n=1 Tax=Caerostris darwini TaxID=1538125 RepID=A0AAV4PXI5_9ARAC|nr:hypothetical protein CDAR_229861 [Caerostris darwini]
MEPNCNHGLAQLEQFHEFENIQEVEGKKRVWYSLHPGEVHTIQKVFWSGTVQSAFGTGRENLDLIIEGQAFNMTRGEAREGNLHFYVAKQEQLQASF